MPLRVAVAWVWTAAFWAGACLLQVLTFKSLLRDRIHLVARFWGRSTFAILGIRLEILGESTLETPGPKIVVFNHQSALDMLWSAAICPPRAMALGKKEIVFVPFINIGWWAMDFRLVDRSNPSKARASLAQVAREIDEDGRALMIAPEGTRSPTGELLPFKRGAFVVAVQSQAPIHPVVISGAHALLPRSGFLPSQGVIRLRYLEPIPTAGLTVSGIDDLISRVRGAMSAALAAQSQQA